MEMKVDGARVKREREHRAWSQEHLAGASALSLRTIQRIETAGTASYDSLNALAAVFSLSVNDLRLPAAEQTAQPPASVRRLAGRRILALGGALLVGTVLAPPAWTVQLSMVVALYLSVEIGILFGRRPAGEPTRSGT